MATESIVLVCLELVANSSNVRDHDSLLLITSSSRSIHPSSPKEHPVCLKMPVPSECIKCFSTAPRVEYLTSLPRRGLGTFLSVSTFNHKRASMSCLQ